MSTTARTVLNPFSAAPFESHALEEGMSWLHIEQMMNEARAGDFVWTTPHNFTASYFAGDDVAFIAREAFCRHIGDNITQRHALHPSLIKYETEVLEFVKRLLNAPANAAGTVTTGGSESIMLAMKAARDRARALKPEITEPELILPQSAYPVFNKAAHNLGIKVVQMETSPNCCADLEGMQAAINENTIMLVGSAPPFPFGIVDPISELAELAEKHDIWLHVDTCIGGFVLPFAEAVGRPVPSFDFRLPAVKSMSIDFHKYGYAMRGCSALILRDKELEEYQGYSFGVWPAGDYYSKNIAGSRSGGPVASAWAVIRYLGYNGFRNRMRKILEATDLLVEGINVIPDLSVDGAPEGIHFSFSSEALDMTAIADELVSRGWGINIGTKPPSILLMLSAQHTPEVVDEFLADLKDTAEKVRTGRLRREDNGALYKIY